MIELFIKKYRRSEWGTFVRRIKTDISGYKAAFFVKYITQRQKTENLKIIKAFGLFDDNFDGLY